MSVINNQKLMATRFVLDVRNFAYLELMAFSGCSVKCPVFNPRSINKMFKFLIYPKGKSNERYIGFYLTKLHPSNKIAYNFTLSVGRLDSTPVKSYKYTNVRFMDNSFGEEFFLLKKSNSWIFKDTVRFQCDITEICPENKDLLPISFSNAFNSPYVLPDYENLSLDLERVMYLPFNSDLTVKMGGYEIYIHKYILFTRCPRLCFVFGYQSIMEMPEIIEAEVNNETFEYLIYYIYTGKLKDSKISLQQFRFALLLKLVSLIHCIYELAYSYDIYFEPFVENQIISWNLDELNFLEEGSTLVHIFRTRLYAEQLAIQVSVSNGCGNDICKFIHVSFKYFRLRVGFPVSLICKISLTSQAGLEAFKEEHHVFRDDEKWDFPRISCQNKEYRSIQDMCLTAELSMYDGSNTLVLMGTKTKIYTNYQTVTENLENLRKDMDNLLNLTQSTGNLILLSMDNKFFRVHDAIMWARWPGIRKLLDASSISSDDDTNSDGHLDLKLPSEVLNILLQYLYTGYTPQLKIENVELLIKHCNYPEFPDHLVEKCEFLLDYHDEKQ